MEILYEIFSVLVLNTDLVDVISFYNINKKFRFLLSTPYILNLIGFKSITDLLNYVLLGLPAVKYLTEYNFQLYRGNINIKEQIILAWTNKDISRVSALMNLKINWHTRKISSSDLFRLYMGSIMENGIFIKVYIYNNLQIDIEMSINDDKTKTICKNYLHYFKHHYDKELSGCKKYLSEKHWLLLNDKTPEEAVDILTTLGY